MGGVGGRGKVAFNRQFAEKARGKKETCAAVSAQGCKENVGV